MCGGFAVERRAGALTSMATKMSARVPRRAHRIRNGARLWLTSHHRELGRTALRETERGVLAEHWDVHPTRASHRTKLGAEVAAVCALLSHPQVNGSVILAALLSSWESRQFDGCNPEIMEARLEALLSREHGFEAAQNAALQSGENVVRALLCHIAALLEIVALIGALGYGAES